jgi:hypothetical protein
MQSRAAALRERHRRIFACSLGIAAVLHVAVFATWPGFRVEHLTSEAPETAAEFLVGDGQPVYVEVVFGPPEVVREDGRLVRQNRRLEAGRVIILPEDCLTLGNGNGALPHGRVWLRVGEHGDADAQGIQQSTGNDCADEAIRTMADALLYHWLPNERYPAPLDVIQPVTLLPTDR